MQLVQPVHEARSSAAEDAADLHTHSHYSDGEWSPSKLVRAARRAGLRAISLTDHDTTRGLPEAAQAGEKEGVEVIPGVEISTWLDGDLHLLGYGFDPDNAELSEVLEHFQNVRRDRAARTVERLDALGMPIRMEQVLEEAGRGAIGRPHVARALLAAGHVRSIREAFDLYLGDGRPACVEKARIDPGEAIRLLHQAGGVAVAAHPGSQGGSGRLGSLLAAGLDGVEVHHRLHGSSTVRELRELADSRGLAKTGGSDFHGPRMGSADIASVTVPYDWVLDLLERIRIRREAAAKV